MQAAQKKRLEEKNAKLIRELASIPANRNCFECGQRGPTYVNITEGSFCCTQCSGILRGLNPPHRVKSISMAAFTTDEVEKLGRLGNAENAKVWLGLYGGTPPAMTNRDVIQTFLVKKYEQKAWYLSKAELSEQERLMNQAKETASRTSSHGTGSVTSTTTNRPSNFDLLSDGASWPDRNKSIVVEPQPTEQAFSPPGCFAPPPPFSFDQPIARAAAVQSAPNTDLLGLFDSPRAPFNGTALPVLPPTNTPFNSSQPAQNDPFADFDRKFSNLSVRPSNTISTFNGPLNQPVPTMPKSVTVDSGLSGILQPMPTTTPAPNPFQINMTPMQPAKVSAPPASTIPATVAQGSASDKYSALAELDELFHHVPSNQTNDGKPSWMPTGFSTGIPPSATTGNLNLNGTPRQQPQRVPVGSFPKSLTMQVISDYGGNNPFLQNSSQSFAQAAFPNPFEPPPVQGQYPVPPIQPVQQQPNWGMGQPIIPPRPTSSSTAAAPNWNPFL